MGKHPHPSTWKSWDYWFNVDVSHHNCDFWANQEYFDYWHEDDYCVLGLNYPNCWGWTH